MRLLLLSSLSFLAASSNTIAYRDGLYVAAGIETSDASVMGSPFDPGSIRLKDEEVSMQGSIKMHVVSDEQEMANVLTN